jgi:pyruvate kinase
VRHCRTKIVCTLGPASGSRDALRSLVDAGLNVARVNFSHATHAHHRRTIATVREVSEELSHPIAILGDLQGPKIRIGALEGPIELTDGSDIVLVSGREPRAGEIGVTYDHLAGDVHVGDRILLDDGLLELIVLDVSGARVTARVIHGGPLSSHKGINLPGVQVSAPSLTADNSPHHLGAKVW